MSQPSPLTAEPEPFAPPFCPSEGCHHHHDPAGWRYAREGSYRRKCDGRRVRRFSCRACGRHFSAQAFSTTYWLKKPHLQPLIFHALVACSGFRQTARSLAVAPSTVMNQALRLGRHCLLHAQRNGPSGNPSEALVVDGLRTFEFSQYWPFDLDAAVGQRTHYIYGMGAAELRRSGSMTRRQRRRRAELEQRHGRPDPQATRHDVTALLRAVAPEPGLAVVFSDEHSSYPPALRDVKHLQVVHRRTSSKEARTSKNPLWPVNLLDMLTRHSSADQKRETIAFSKRRNNALLRFAVLRTWRNFVKPLREREPATSGTPAMLLKLAKRRLAVEDVLSERLFPSRVLLHRPLADCYWGRLLTRQLPRCRVHEPRFAA